jgi:hypothetical protein
LFPYQAVTGYSRYSLIKPYSPLFPQQTIASCSLNKLYSQLFPSPHNWQSVPHQATSRSHKPFIPSTNKSQFLVFTSPNYSQLFDHQITGSFSLTKPAVPSTKPLASCSIPKKRGFQAKLASCSITKRVFQTKPEDVFPPVSDGGMEGLLILHHPQGSADSTDSAHLPPTYSRLPPDGHEFPEGASLMIYNVEGRKSICRRCSQFWVSLVDCCDPVPFVSLFCKFTTIEYYIT